MNKYLKTIRLSLDNIHLLDLFSPHNYIEVGNIDYKLIRKLLLGLTIKLDKIVDYNIQAMGLGKSEVTNPTLAANLPYIFFSNLHEENQSMQVLLTYGLIAYENDNGQEAFAPLVLLPIRLYYEDGLFSLFLEAAPLPNEQLINQLRRKGYIVPTERLETINDFMRFCLNAAKISKQRLELESYFTLAKTVQPQIVMNHERFSLNNNITWPLAQHYYNAKTESIPFIRELSFRQRQAVQRAYYGNSFGIVGPIGSGKTTTLLAIGASALERDKRVLYLSAQKKTLKGFVEELKNYQLDSLTIDFTSSLSCILMKLKQQVNITKEADLNLDIIKQELQNTYSLLDVQDSFFFQRIRNFLFAEVIGNLLTLGKDISDEPIDDLSNIYRHEYTKIIYALEKIANDLDKIPYFKESKFIHIPLNHQIEYPNQVITLLFQIHQNFQTLLEVATSLEAQFQIRKIENYAKFKNIINDIRNLSVEMIPSSWKRKTLNNFQKAKELYPTIKQEVYSVQELELYLDWDYQNLDNFDVNEAINIIYATYWQEENQEEIENIITNHLALLNQLRLGLHNIRIYNKAIIRLKVVLDWAFDENDEEVLALIIKLADHLKNYKVFYKWLNINKYQETRESILDLLKRLKRYEYLESQYLRYFTSLNEIDNNIINLVKMDAKGKISPKFKSLVLEDFIEELKEFKDLYEDLIYLKAQYKSLTGLEYLRSDDIIYHYDACYQFLKTIKNDLYRRSIVKFLTDLKAVKLTEYLQDLNNFVHSYQINNDIYNYVGSFFPMINYPHQNEKQNFIQESYKYISKVYEVNYKINQVLKNNSEKNVSFTNYLLLRKRLSDLATLKNKISTNLEYKEIYGKLFLGEKTNVNELGIIIDSFTAFSEIFTDSKLVKDVLSEERMLVLHNLIDKTDPVFAELTQLFKTYSRLFKDGIGGFYYDDLKVTIDRVESLMYAKDELIAYLDLTSHLQTLQEYKLFLLSNAIVNGKTDFIDFFKTKYFAYLYHEFLLHQKSTVSSDNLCNNLNVLSKLEKVYCQANLQSILHKEYSRKAPVKSISSLMSLVNKTEKQLFLATPEILNRYLDINAFDLVLIDDAQLLHANEYHQAIQGKQVIIAGEELLHYMNQTTLISRMRPNYLVNFQERFVVSPLHLSRQIPNIVSPFYALKAKNQGIELISNNIIEEIVTLLANNRYLKINIYVKNIEKKRSILDELSQKALDLEIDSKIIEEFLLDNISIIDLLSGYSRQADINILYLQDYYNLNLEFIDALRLSNLLLPKEKLIFYDPRNLLESASEYGFIKMIKTLIISSLNPFQGINTQIGKIVSEYFNNFAINTLGSYNDISLILEKDDKYYGIVIYCDIERSSCELLNLYRTYYNFGDDLTPNIYFVFINDLYTQKELVLGKIVKEINNE